ncbi:type IIL restriction-modification enzyme MmeI, partial [Sinomonas sp. G460-2]|uniref:type IIL restriction-modification enzyme MmeI n=1 Tax=Sinomonas sp. G460-2 TaxID=3393464 RepID=UPI0039EF8FBE
WREERAREYPLPYARLAERVKPERQRKKPSGNYALRKPLPERWWQYGEKRPALREALAELSEMLVIARVSKTVMPLRVLTGQVPSEQLVVFAADDYGAQAVLSSSLHQLWAITYGSTLETRVRYTPSDVFETFPLPTTTERLTAAGAALDQDRREVMLRRGLGLTKLYNLVNDPALQGDTDITRLRDIHVEIDEAVFAAYGWDDLRPVHGFHSYRQAERWTLGAASRVEALDRLLHENHRRAGIRNASLTLDTASNPDAGANTLFD